MTTDRSERLKARLESVFGPGSVTVRDDSALHAGHEGARGGAGHYTVSVSSRAFTGMGPLQRHRLVYAAVADMMPDEVHALSIDTVVPEERRDVSFNSQ